MTAVATLGLVAIPSAAQAGPDRAGRPAVVGAGEIRLNEPNSVGDRITFAVAAATVAGGSSRGRLTFRHERPDGTLAGQGWADVTCLRVHANEALLTAVVPDGVGPVRNHAFYMKIVDGGSSSPDRISFIQAQNGPDRPPRRCIDFDVEYPGAAIRYPVLTVDYLVHNG